MNRIGARALALAAFLIPSLALPAAAEAPLPSGPAPRRAALVIPPRNYYDPELFAIRDALLAAGIEAVVLCPSLEPARGSQGGTISPDGPLEELGRGDFDAVCVIGGTGTLNHLFRDPELKALLFEARDRGLIVSGICAGATLLAETGILEGRRATGHNRGYFVRGGASYSEEVVVADGPFLTAQGDYHKEFAEALVKAILGT